MSAVINTVLLNRRIETYFGTESSFVPMIHGSVDATSDAIRVWGDKLILVTAYVSSDPKLSKRDVTTYQKRLARLAAACGYAASTFVFAGPCKIVANLSK